MSERLAQTSDKPNSVKKNYHKPNLVTYGSVREITKTAGGTQGMNDGGAGPDKTG